MDSGSRAKLCRFCLVASLLALEFSSTAAESSRAEPWLGESFSAPAAEVARAASQVTAASDVVMLLRDDRFSLDVDGRLTHHRRWVYRILSASGLEDWSLSEATWLSRHQARPRVRARVIDAAGGEQRVESERYSELTADAAGLSDGRLLIRAPLPVSVGAVVEEEVEVRDVEPKFADGVSAKHVLVMQVPVRRGRVILEAPTRLPLRYGVRGFAGLEPRREILGDRVRLTFDYAGMPAARAPETSLPPDVPRYPHIAFSTGESWAALATAYSRSIDAQIALSSVPELLAWMPPTSSGAQIDRVAEILERVRSKVRYQAAELASQDLLPAAPLDVLERGTGDGLDLATLMTALLRAEGVPAFVALLRAGFGMDVELELPGFGRFNHALVYLPAGEPVWIDPGDPFSRVGELASDRRGRQALVVSPSTEHLLVTPSSPPRDNRTVTTIEVQMADDGPARIVETSVHHGAAERRQRIVSSQLDAEDRRQGYEAYVRSAYRAEALGSVEETAAEDLSEPFRLQVEALRAGRAWTQDSEAALAIDLSYLLTSLPRELLVGDAAARRGDFYFHEPLVTEWRYRIQPPSEMKLRELPPSFEKPLGSGSLRRIVRREKPGVQVDFELATGPGRLTLEQFRAFHAAVQELMQAEPLVLWFDDAGRKTKKRQRSKERDDSPRSRS